MRTELVPSIEKLDEEQKRREEDIARRKELLAGAKKPRPEVGPRTLKKAAKDLKRVRKARANGRRPRRVARASLEVITGLVLK